MKIQKKEASKVFQPITLEITIESLEEYRAIKEMASVYNDVPQTLIDNNAVDQEHQDKIEGFFFDLHCALKD